MIRKRSLSLIEVVIALALTSLLLSVLFQGYRQLPIAQKKAQAISSKILSLKKVDQTLSSLFSNVIPQVNDDKPTLYTVMIPESHFPALFLTYFGEIDPDPDFSELVQGALFVSRDHELCFTTWGKGEKSRTDLLLTGISSLSFSFFEPRWKQWTENWPLHHPAFPPLIEVTLKFTDQKEQTFAYSLPEAIDITYRSQK